MFLFKYYLSGLNEAVTKTRIKLLTETGKSKKWFLMSFYTIVIYLMKRFAMEDNIAIVDANLRNFEHVSLRTTGCAQRL